MQLRGHSSFDARNGKGTAVELFRVAEFGDIAAFVSPELWCVGRYMIVRHGADDTSVMIQHHLVNRNDVMQISLAGKNALVTGASSGLGPFIVQALDEAGANIALHYHGNKTGAETVAAACSNKSAIIQADLGDTHSVDQLFDDARAALGDITILVNCAAAESQNVEDLAKLSNKQWAMTQQANVQAPMKLIQHLAAQEKPGSVINISSIEGSRPAFGHAHYATSKAALEMLSQAAALEFGPLGVRVNAIAPGLIHRDGIEEGWPEGVSAWKSAAPLGRLVDPKNIASAAVYLASDNAASISGSVLTIDCGLSVRPGW